LRRILGRLLKAGLVTSREGVAGGVSLRARPEQIRVLDIMRVFQGEVALSECMFRKRICANRGTCVLRKHIKRIERALADEFAAISIADLLREDHPHGGKKKRGAR
jgi:Rrf2 family cysteine metabolism transcriptional repressor